MDYNKLKREWEETNMDTQLMKKLDKQGFLFVALHTLILLNFAAEFLLVS